MKNILSILSIMVIFAVVVSCGWDDFGDLNVNPNESTSPKTSALLTNSMLTTGSNVLATTGALYVQHISNKQYTSADNYQVINFASDFWYDGPLADLQRIIEINTGEATKVAASIDGSNENQIAIAKIMQSYYFLFLTDRWGDLPYSEALRGIEGILTPKFDPQSEIYDGCIQTLKDASAMITTGPGTIPIRGDILLDGDMELWKKMSNTIRLVAAQRLSKVNPTKAATEFALAFNAGVIALDNSENLKYRYLNIQTYENPYFSSFVTQNRRDWVIPDPMMNMMQLLTYTSPHSGGTGKMNVVRDPRLPVYANPIENTVDVFIGMPYGLTEADAGSIPNSQVSFLGNAFRQQNSPAFIYTSAQIAFALAEGVVRGWIPGDAKTYYEQGILASLNQHGVGAGFGAYMTNSEVAYNPARALEQILTQKWIALFPNGYEAWAEWRRTGFPNLTPSPNALTPSLQIPRRQAYGTTEANLNSENHQAALARQGFANDDLDGRVWWDANN